MEVYRLAVIGMAAAMVVIAVFAVVVAWVDTIKSNREWDKKHKKV